LEEDVAVRRGRWWALVLLGFAVPGPADAAAGQVIAARGPGVDVAIDHDGRAFLVSPSTHRFAGTLPSVRARSADPGARFGPSRMLLRSDRADRAVDAGVAADGSGVIVVQSSGGPERRVRVVAFGARGRVGRPVTISGGRGNADFAASAVASSGAAIVVWFRHRGDRRWRLEASIRSPRGGAFGAPQPLSAFVRRPCCTHVSVAIGERGHAAAAWTSTSRPRVWAALRRPGRRFRPARRVAEASSDAPEVVVGAGGAAALLHGIEHVPRRASDGLQLHRAVPGGSFGPAEQVELACGPSAGEATVTPAGRVLVACLARSADPGGARVRVFEAGPREPLALRDELGRRPSPERLAVAADDAGRAVVAWPERVAAGPPHREQAVAAMRRAHGAPFGAAVVLGRPWSAAEPDVARLVPDGGALVAWRAARFGPRTERRSLIIVTRVP
jgi:hypothetical protein